MRQPREVAIAAPALEQRRERDTMKAARAGGRDRLLEGQSGELVPERDVPVSGYEHTRGDALVESGVDRAGERLDKPRLGTRRRDRNGVEHVSCARREAPRSRENGVANRRGDLRPTQASTSVTKNALPAVVRWSSCGSIPCGSASRATASGERGERGTRRRGTADASSPSMSRNG